MIFECGFVCRGELRGVIFIILVIFLVMDIVVPGFRRRGRPGRRGGRIIKGRFARWRDSNRWMYCLRLRVKGVRLVWVNEMLHEGVKLVVEEKFWKF